MDVAETAQVMAHDGNTGSQPNVTVCFLSFFFFFFCSDGSHVFRTICSLPGAPVLCAYPIHIHVGYACDLLIA